MDSHLKRLADASLEVEAAEAAFAETAHHAAAERLDAADAVLAELRAAWPEMAAGERAVVGPAAGGVRERADAVRRALPSRSALTVGTPVSDPEEDEEPPG